MKYIKTYENLLNDFKNKSKEIRNIRKKNF